MKIFTTSNLIHNHLIKKWETLRKQNKKRGEIISPDNALGSAYNIPSSSTQFFRALFPELLFGWSEPRFDQRQLISFYPAERLNEFHQIKAVLLCHSLNPTWETVALVSEVGRALRLSTGLDLPLHIMLANNSWSGYNWVVKDLDLFVNLGVNLEWRKKMYEMLGIYVDICGSDASFDDKEDLELNFIKPAMTYEEIDKLATEYSILSEIIWGKGITGKRLSNEEEKEILNSINLFSSKNKYQDALKLSVVSKSLIPHIEILKSVASNLHRLDRDTFFYFLLQYYHQSKYSNHLKIAVKREYDFDKPFHELERNLFKNTNSDFGYNRNFSTQLSAYFHDYYFSRDKDTQLPLTVHPYYFPSGRLYYKYPLPLEAKTYCIMIDDEDQEKIMTSISVQHPLHRACFLSDLLSFAHFLSLSDKVTGNNVKGWLHGIDKKYNLNKELIDSWEIYATNKSEFSKRVRSWNDIMFSIFMPQEIPPYYFMPFVWSHVGVTISDEVELVKTILKSLRNAVGIPQLLREPESTE